ncbi:MAG: Nif3-like dinuclear metal center hexameric protein [Nitrospirota bacterium]|nr:Nif3-like dinuclear metal center hexameric protein [Nitrospirota bacterium]
MTLIELTAFLDEELGLLKFPEDESSNGLQIEGRADIRKVGIAVDACAHVFNSAAKKNIDFLFVHHGIIWGGLKNIRGVIKNRIKTLLESDISLYACHLPLDQHPEYGNNSQLLKLLSIEKMGEFGEYHGKKIGCWGKTGSEMSLADFVSRIDGTLGTKTSSISFGRKVRNVGVVSGGGWFAINEAEKYGIDTFLTGEPSHSAYTLAEEMKVNLLFAGHYATETPGVKAVGELLRKKFGLDIEFIDHPTGL